MIYDALIVGAGPAGSTTALLLARAGWSVALVEKTPFPRRKVCGEFISAHTLSLLAGIGLDGIVACAGPEIREVAVYAGERMLAAPMPRADGLFAYGRALGRDRLDAALLEAARGAGATVYQPWRVHGYAPEGDRFVCTVSAPERSKRLELPSRVLIAAHGSWDSGPLEKGAKLEARKSRRTALSGFLAFKAHFTGATLARERMPLLAFAGGYGGLVSTDRGRVTFSCCIRRDALARCRAALPDVPAGEAVLAHVLATCRGAREALGGARRDESWLAAGPLRPGLRRLCGDGYFAVGNALGEAHPIVAEGISMAIQSAFLLCARLTAVPRTATTACWNAAARGYEAAYRAQFAPRIHAASVFAAISTRPRIAATAAGMLEAAPALLAFGARCAGKSAALRRAP
ncbi:MAG TPA: NAD(P)/FAD-dependent oxidoreductase [Burkholderiales bacterium]|nr:NAD(P)/FAD-dependent oxidoreductase [Burkholderiales bacterium]